MLPGLAGPARSISLRISFEAPELAFDFSSKRQNIDDLLESILSHDLPEVGIFPRPGPGLLPVHPLHVDFLGIRNKLRTLFFILSETEK